MLPIKSWKIYYADGSSFDSTQGQWAEAPSFGVQCIVYYHVPPYKTLDSSEEGIYVYQGIGDKKHIKLGLWMDDEGFYRVQDLALHSTNPEVT